MFSSLLKKQMMRAGFLLLVSSFLIPSPAQAAPIEKVEVALDAAGGDLPPAVEKRVVSSISSIGNRVFVGKEENLFALNSSAYDKVLADIINRVVIGYVVSDLSVNYGRDTSIHVTLQPVGQIIRHVDTEIDYGGLSPDAARYVAEDTADVPSLMENLLIGLPVDSVGWAESVSQSAGRDLLSQILPEFQQVRETKILNESDPQAVDLLQKKELVMYTCYPFDMLSSTDQRFFVYADKVSGPVLK